MVILPFSDLKVDVHRKDSTTGLEEAVVGATGGVEEGAVGGATGSGDGASAAGSPRNHGSVEVMMVDEVNAVITPTRTPGWEKKMDKLKLPSSQALFFKTVQNIFHHLCTFYFSTSI